MAKKKPNVPEPDPEHYEYVKATASDGVLTIKVKLFGNDFEETKTHGEDISEYSRQEIETFVRKLLNIMDDDPVTISVDW
jgi:hypothetical protein